MNDCITTTKQSATKSCAYFLGYTVSYDGRHAIFYSEKFCVSFSTEPLPVRVFVNEDTPQPVLFINNTFA